MGSFTGNVYDYTSEIIIECFCNIIFVSICSNIVKYFSATRLNILSIQI